MGTLGKAVSRYMAKFNSWIWELALQPFQFGVWILVSIGDEESRLRTLATPKTCGNNSRVITIETRLCLQLEKRLVVASNK
jgi:hypothetical protein